MTEILGTAQNPTNLSKTTEALQGPEEFFLSDYNIDSIFLKKKIHFMLGIHSCTH